MNMVAAGHATKGSTVHSSPSNTRHPGMQQSAVKAAVETATDVYTSKEECVGVGTSLHAE